MPLICNTGHANLIWPFVAWFGSAQVAKSKSTLLELETYRQNFKNANLEASMLGFTFALVS